MKEQRCPKCAGRLEHLLTDIRGRRYYRCTAGLTRGIARNLENQPGSTRIQPCGTVVREGDRENNFKNGVFIGLVAYRSGGKVQFDAIGGGA